jgi:hypothetical protein
LFGSEGDEAIDAGDFDLPETADYGGGHEEGDDRLTRPVVDVEFESVWDELIE